MSQTKPFLYYLFLVFPLIGVLSACNKQGTNTEKITLVKTTKVQPWTAHQPSPYPGKIKAAADVKLAFRVAGPIHRFLVEEGQFVKKGQLIAEIDPRDYQIQLAATQAEYEQIKAEAERVIELHNRNSVATNDYDKAVSGLNRIKAKLNAHQNALNDTKLRAPFDGYIQEQFFDAHETVSAGLPVVSLINTSWYEVEIDLPASDYVRQDQFESFLCEADVYPGKQFPLELLEMTQKSNLNQLYKVRLKLDKQPDLQLAAGMSVNVTIGFRQSDNNLVTIPVAAIFCQGEQPLVYIYQDGTIEQRTIHISEIMKDGTAIIEGAVKAGETIVTAGVHTLKNGQKVELLKPVSKTNVGGLL